MLETNVDEIAIAGELSSSQNLLSPCADASSCSPRQNARPQGISHVLKSTGYRRVIIRLEKWKSSNANGMVNGTIDWGWITMSNHRACSALWHCVYLFLHAMRGLCRKEIDWPLRAPKEHRSVVRLASIRCACCFAEACR